jgi:hypothetical protein
MAIQPRDVGQILTDAFEVYRRNWQTLVSVAAVVILPLALISYFVQHALRHTTVVTGAGNTVVISAPAFWRSVGASLVFAFLTFFAWSVLAGAITRAVASEAAGLETDVAASYRFGLARIWPILLVGLLVGLSIACGFVLFVIPGIFLLTRLAVAIPVLVVEDRRGTEAMKRSWNLVTGRSWPVLGTLVLAWLLVGVVNSLLTLPFSGTWFLQGIMSAIASVITLPFSVLVSVILYMDLRARRENLTTATLQRDLQASAA